MKHISCLREINSGLYKDNKQLENMLGNTRQMVLQKIVFSSEANLKNFHCTDYMILYN